MLLNHDAPRVLQRVSQTHQKLLPKRRAGAAGEELGLHLPLAAGASPTLPARARVCSSLLIALTCSLASRRAAFRHQTFGCFENDPQWNS